MARVFWDGDVLLAACSSLKYGEDWGGWIRNLFMEFRVVLYGRTLGWDRIRSYGRLNSMSVMVVGFSFGMPVGVAISL